MRAGIVSLALLVGTEAYTHIRNIDVQEVGGHLAELKEIPSLNLPDNASIRIEGKKALKLACRNEPNFPRCQTRKGFGSGRYLVDCLSAGKISEGCTEGLGTWMRLLADTSASSPEETLHLTNHWHHRSPPDQTRLGSRHQIEYINPVEDGLELLPRGYRAPHEPCEHARDDRPTSSFSVLMDWMFVDFLDGSSSLDSWLAMDSSSSDSSSSSDESFDAASSSQESSSSSSEDSTRHHHYTHGRNQGHGHDHDHGHTIPYDGISAHEINYDKLNKPRPMFLDHSNQRSHHIRSRNSLPDKYEESGWFEDLELDEGCDYVEGALTVFFFVGAFTLLFFPFFLLARALKRMVRNARESHYNGASAVLPSMPPRPASSGFGDCAERRRGTAAAAAYGYQALPDVEDSAATDDDAIVVTGMPVNPPPSVTN